MLNPPAAEPEQPEEPEVKNGLVSENGKLYYYVDGVKTYAGLVLVDGDYYYINSSMAAVTGEYYVWKTNGLLPETTYTFGEDGKMLNPPVAEPDLSVTYEQYTQMTDAEQTAFRDAFDSLDDFFAWYNEAKDEYDEQNPSIDVGDGSVDLEDLMNGT